MARESSTSILDPLRRLICRQVGSSLSDAQLLENFVARRDEASFEVLVWRHGAMVLALCTRILRDAHEAEDAFQAAFLVFARKAGSIGRGESVACWLYKVGYRIALRLRAASAKRQHEPMADYSAPELPDDANWRELRPVLDDEIARLPEKYRAPFVLCYLEGRTNEEAAAQLGCPKGTVLSRLARGRERLRHRLTRRGIALTVPAFALTLTQNAAAATVPNALVISTTDVAIPFAAGKAATELVSAPVAALIEGALRAMTFTSIKSVAAVLLAVAVLGTGITFAARGEADSPAPVAAAVPAPNADPVAEDPERQFVLPNIKGQVVDIAKDGKSLTLNAVPFDLFGGRSDPPVEVVVKLSDKTRVSYGYIGLNEAKLTKGYIAQVAFTKDSKEIAQWVHFSGREQAQGSGTVSGSVDTIAEDGKSFTVSLLWLENAPPTDPFNRTARVDIPFDDKTILSFSNVAKGGAKLTRNYHARVKYADNGRTAGKVTFVGPVEPSHRESKEPDFAGKVTRANDGKAIEVEVPAKTPGGAPTRIVTNLTDKTNEVFCNVPLNGTKATEGMQAQVWLAEGSKDTAAKVTFTGTTPERWTIITGKVVAVAKDGKSFTVETPSAKPGDVPKRAEVKVISLTKYVFYDVGPGEAKIAEGLTVRARLLEDSLDIANEITFTKVSKGSR